MPFKFRLEKVLKYRKQIVEKHTRDVGEANRVVVAIEQKVQRIEDDIVELMNANSMEINTTLNVETMIARSSWLGHLEALQTEIEVELNTAEAERDHRRALLAGAWQDQEVLERLRAKQKQQWIDDQQKLENKDLDEVGQIRADRQQREKVSSL